MPTSRIGRCLLLAGCLFAHADARPQVVYTCVGPEGARIHTSQPCPDGHRTASTRPFERETGSAGGVASAPTMRAASVPQPGRKRESTSTKAAKPLIDQKRLRCERAKAKREAALERAGLKRTFDLLRRLDDEVHAACR